MRTHSHPGRIGSVAVAAFAALALATSPAQSGAQEQAGCRFAEGTSNLTYITLSGGERIYYMSTPRIQCDDGVRITADSAVTYQSQNMTYLIGDVHYRDRTRELRSDEARYFSRIGRLQAQGHLFVEDTIQGSVIENGDLVYLRKTSFREQEQMTVKTGPDGVRPTALLYMQAGADTAGAEDTTTVDVESAAALQPPPLRRAPGPEPDTARVPYNVEADQLFLEGDRYFNANGRVVIERDSLLAYADSAEYDQLAARMLLQGSARVDGSAYDLKARTIAIGLPGGQMRSVRAMHDAELVGEDLRLTAPVIQVFTTDGSMDRLVAVPMTGEPAEGADPPPALRDPARDSLDRARPRAEAENFELVADSIEVNAPAQVLKRIFATGAARGESSARDSLNTPTTPAVARRDWLEGDTVIATFLKVERDPLVPVDSTRDDYELERLVARGTARSLYRLAPSDSAAQVGVDRPAVHYVTGREIEIVMREGEVDSMRVVGPTQGWHLEPRTRAPRDSLGRSDTARTAPDTAASPQAPAARTPAAVQQDQTGRPAPGRDAVPGRPARSVTEVVRRRRQGR